MESAPPAARKLKTMLTASACPLRETGKAALAVPAISWVKQSALFLVLAAVFLIGLGMTFWSRQRDAHPAIRAPDEPIL
jgi:hypothetical protein